MADAAGGEKQRPQDADLGSLLDSFRRSPWRSGIQLLSRRQSAEIARIVPTSQKLP